MEKPHLKAWLEEDAGKPLSIGKACGSFIYRTRRAAVHEKFPPIDPKASPHKKKKILNEVGTWLSRGIYDADIFPPLVDSGLLAPVKFA
ncbi:MAG: hypothetical protein ACLFUF_05895 [Opitutales bacterium]